MNWRPYARLVRLPNLPTPLADIALAALAVAPAPLGWVAFPLILGASACLYMAGMVFNDYFDLDEDKRDRPERPIASGAITPWRALRLGVGLLVGGVLLAAVAAPLTPSLWWPPMTTLALVGAILAYDGGMKRTWLGPVVMGSCRFLNVLLGTTLGGAPGWMELHLAAVVGLYIVGVTWFARTEAHASSKKMLAGSAAVMVAALVLALPLPIHRAGMASPAFVYLLVGLGFFVGLPVYKAIIDPSPARVQAGVKRALMGLILLDTVAATAVAGTWGLVILVLMAPSVYLNSRRWMYAT